MAEIIHEGQVYAIHDTINSIEPRFPMVSENQEGSKWYGEDREAMQASRMCYNKHKIFRAHTHILRPRLNNYTQECFIIHKGVIKLDIYSQDKELLANIVAREGDIVILYRGYHAVEVLEDDSIFYEIKNGPFTTVDEDKTYL